MRVHLVDGTFELFRAHYSKRPDHKAPAGWDAKATVGVVQSLINMTWDPHEKVTHVAVAFDNPIVSFRNKLYAGYKSDEGIDPALRSQFDAVEEAIRALGMVVWSMDEFEADDALAAGAALYAKDPRVEEIRLMTPDKDMNQCLTGTRIIQINRIQQKTITAETVLKDRGITPESIPDFLALTGDTADGYPGLDGWGEKGAATVLAYYKHLEAIPKLPYEWKVKPRGADRLADELDKHRADAMLFRTLATLRTDVPLKESLDDLAWHGPAKEWDAWCDKLGVPDMKNKPRRKQSAPA
jgi:5'-3' exonuclease